MREKSKELQRLRDDSNKRGGGGGMKSMNSMGSGGYSGGGPSPMASMASSIQVDIPKTTYQPPMPSVLFLIHIIRYLFIKYSKPFLFINFENHYLSKNRNSSFCYYYHVVVKKKREFFFFLIGNISPILGRRTVRAKRWNLAVGRRTLRISSTSWNRRENMSLRLFCLPQRQLPVTNFHRQPSSLNRMLPFIHSNFSSIANMTIFNCNFSFSNLHSATKSSLKYSRNGIIQCSIIHCQQ